jgi:molecular chaperone DnaK (HSP70)
MAGTLAIDLGSTSTVVAFQEPGQPPRLLAIEPFALGEPPVVPTLIWLADAGAGLPLIGRQVLEAGLLHQGGAALHRDFKRAIGGQRQGDPSGSGADLEQEAESGTGHGPHALPANTLSPEQAGSLLLQRIWRQLPAGIAPDRLAIEALRCMDEHQITQLAVLENERIVGALHLHDLLAAKIA